MGHPLYLVDAFTDRPFGGNPAAVCLLEEERDTAWLQSVAMEMNQAETAFLLRRDDGFGLRWFTPTVEVDLCGHATLAGAHVLWEAAVLRAAETARFHTRSGLLTAVRSGDTIDLDFPAETAQAIPKPKGLEEMLGARCEWTGRNRMDILALLESEEAVRFLTPDLASVARLDCRGLIVTAPGSGPYDFVSRFFAPQSGISEDPVTGSAHCALAPFWAERLGKTDLAAYQASRRGGSIRTIMSGTRVILRGQAITIMKADLLA